jgi:putative sugar O-methyltransferase
MLNKKNRELLKVIISDLQTKKKIYQPTYFWRSASNNLLKTFIKKGITNFKRNVLANNFFIPRYGLNKNIKTSTLKSFLKKNQKFSNKILNYSINLYSGKLHAFSDYRVFKSANDDKKYPLLDNFSETKVGNPIEQFNFENKKFSRSSLNYLLGLVFLKKNASNFIPKVTLEIGGGYGALGEILSFSKMNNFKYINVDLPVQAFLTENYFLKIFGSSNITQYKETRDNSNLKIKNLKKFTSLVSWQIDNLKGQIDLFVNFISFQEMEPNIVKNYLNKIIKLKPKYVLLRNLKEGKQLKKKNTLGVEKATKSKNYINYLKNNYKLINKNTITFGYKTFDNFNSEVLLFKRIK